MKTVETIVYEYDELPTEKAKANARAWWMEGYEGSDAFEQIKEDAENIGLKITSLSDHRSNEGDFIVSAIECSEAILREHGKACETYKTAKAFDEANDALPELPEETDPNYWAIERELCSQRDENESTFLCSLLEDYRIMLNKEEEYQTSEEYIKEIMEANEYTFTAEGVRFG